MHYLMVLTPRGPLYTLLSHNRRNRKPHINHRHLPHPTWCNNYTIHHLPTPPQPPQYSRLLHLSKPFRLPHQQNPSGTCRKGYGNLFQHSPLRHLCNILHHNPNWHSVIHHKTHNHTSNLHHRTLTIQFPTQRLRPLSHNPLHRHPSPQHHRPQ